MICIEDLDADFTLGVKLLIKLHSQRSHLIMRIQQSSSFESHNESIHFHIDTMIYLRLPADTGKSPDCHIIIIKDIPSEAEVVKIILTKVYVILQVISHLISFTCRAIASAQ